MAYFRYEPSPPKRYAEQFQSYYGLKLKNLWVDYKLPNGHTPVTMESELLERFQTNSSTIVESNFFRQLVGGNRYAMYSCKKEIEYGEGLDRAKAGMEDMINEVIRLNPRLQLVCPPDARPRQMFHFLWGVASSYNKDDLRNFLQPDYGKECRRYAKQQETERLTGIKFDWVCSNSTLDSVYIAFNTLAVGKYPIRSWVQIASRQMADIIQI